MEVTQPAVASSLCILQSSGDINNNQEEICIHTYLLYIFDNYFSIDICNMHICDS